jgi:tetratricopeptide (TPR) repeat protein
VQVILAARIDRLPTEEKQLLQTASVIGEDVPFVLLQAVAEVTEDAVHRGLTHLQAAEFLYETRLFPDPESVASFEQALAAFEQALAAFEHLPQTRERLEQAIDLRFDLRTALFPLGEFERIFDCLREAEGLARTLDDQRRLGKLSVYLCHNLWITGRPTEALAFGHNAQALAESLGDVPLQVTGNLYLGVALRLSGCVPSSPTATSASPSFPGAQAKVSRLWSISPPPSRCTARWTCASGSRRRRRTWEV